MMLGHPLPQRIAAPARAKTLAPTLNADRLKLKGNWKDLVKKSLSKKKPPEGWPK